MNTRPPIPLRLARFAVDEWPDVPTPEGELASMMPNLARANAARTEWNRQRDQWAKANGYDPDEMRAAESIAGNLMHPTYEGRDALPPLAIEWQ